jgi:hypothetical protein
MHRTSRITNAAALLASFPLSESEQAIMRARIANAFTTGNPAGLNGAMGFDINVFEQITAKSYDVKLPEILWNRTIPAASIDTSINVGARLASYRVKDRRGMGAFRATVGKDIPTVGVTMNKVSVPLESAAVSGTVDIDDLRAVAMGFEGMNLITELGAAMREASERHIEKVFFYGFSSLGFAGYLDYSLTPATTAGAKLAGGTTWAVATPDEIIKDIQTALSLVFTNSKGLFVPGRVELPAAQFALIATMRVNGTGGNGINETVLAYIKRNNIYTQTTGLELDVVALRHLEGAGTGGTHRMIVSEYKPENHWLPMPEAFNMLPPMDRQLATDLTAIYKFGSYHRPYPTSAQMMDGI